MKLIHAGALIVLSLGLFTVTPAAAQTAPAEEGAAPANPPSTTTVSRSKLGPTRAPNSINAEGLGAGLVYSINYERLVLEDLGVRVGLSYMSFSASAGTSSASASFTTIPLMVSYLGVGSPHHILEMGGGLSFMYASGEASGVGRSSSGSGLGVLPGLLLGYRLHPVDGAGFQFRVGMMAFVGKGLGYSDTDPTKLGVLPWPYLSLGASF